ncbi:MAG: hypothetical protein RSD71_16630 [Flavobacterium sp.]
MEKRRTEAQILQRYGVLFENVKKDTALATELAEYGYDAATIAQGEELYTNFVQKYDTNKTETAQETSAYAVFSNAFETTAAIYKTDRKKAKIVFKNQPDVLRNLQLNKPLLDRNALVIDTMRLFYDMLHNNSELLNALQRLKITTDHVNQQLANVTNVQTVYAAYVQEKGESQQATQDKNKAFDAVSKWVSEFYSVAKIALEDQPQLLESISKWVRS